MRVCVGGTFNVIHKGHALLFETAFSIGDEVEVGLTSDEFANRGRKVEVLPYVVRKENLRKYLQRFGKPFVIVEIVDALGTAASSREIDAIVVSPNTKSNAVRINELRRTRQLNPLKVFGIREIRADDTLPISSTRILKGEIDKDGHLLRPLKVAIGSTNQVKVNASRNIFSQAFGLVEVIGVDVKSEVGNQPEGAKVYQGALRRARAALEMTGADYGVGIEAGLRHDKASDRYLDVQYCVVVDRSEGVTVGTGPGFEYPPTVIDAVLKGDAVGDVMSEVTGVENIGRRSGSIGYLSDGLIDRTSLSEVAILMALIPRIRPDLYTVPQDDSSSETASR